MSTVRNAIVIGAILVATSLPVRAADATGAAAGKAGPGGWQADPKLVEQHEKKKTPWMYKESEVPAYTLPDPLLCADGTRVTTKEQWEQKRRPETLELFRKHVYGRQPATPVVKFDVLSTDPTLMDGKATLKRIKITAGDGTKSYSFEAALLTPNAAAGKKSPCFVMINNRPLASADPSRKEKNGFWPAEEIIARGYATAVFRTGDVDPDKKGAEERAKGVRGVWPDGGAKPGADGKPAGDAWATISAWAWGASRVMDYLQTDPAIDASKVVVIGHSRGGKTALWASAEDPRFAMAVSSCSGEGGASLSRRRYGETIARITTAFPYWFCENYRTFADREAEMPFDHHQLIALSAPRMACVGSADQDLWADPRGEFLSVAAAGPVFALYGFEGPGADAMPPLDSPLVRGRLSYHVRTGIHNLTPYDWNHYMDVADRLWRP